MSYQVRIADSDHAFDVDDGESVIDAALRAGLMLPYSCRGGTCGTCMGDVVEGRIAYPDGLPPAIDADQDESGKALFCQARPASDLVIRVKEVREAGDIRPQRLPARVEAIEECAPDVRRLFLKLPRDKRLAFLPGQYIDFLLRGGQRRSFSLANTPYDDDLLELHIRHLPGGVFSGHVFNDLKEGALLRFEGPLGNFFLRDDSDRPMILMGGGTGFAPVKGIMEQALHLGLKRPMHIYWGARRPADLYLDSLPRQWAGQAANIAYTPVLSDPEPADEWRGTTGFVHEQVVRDHPDLSGFDVYMSGPPPMINAAREAFAAAGLPSDRLFYDSFEAAPE
ncbi:CDP-6-deoxy-delta-3,4-glucoseen reductase [Spiribacter roseus]|uniref:CDP-6-deoxy-delta-3,4-glucoseen reductase n=1 Tax=Spiribacter roseus TaxID=1855875 RepID=UPI001330BB95|nr:CDP-6-deoxy-delta-3,4-glucoseen reductase [Spiribacter roseus]KAF0283057.1 CDP-6-deoxy-delta-3,4-glucoseen reductase [Spiribacter roseus]